MKGFPRTAVALVCLSTSLGCSELLDEAQTPVLVTPDQVSPEHAGSDSSEQNVVWGDNVDHVDVSLRLGVAVEGETVTILVENVGSKKTNVFVAGGFSLELSGNGQEYGYSVPSSGHSITADDNHTTLESREQYEFDVDLGDYARGEDASTRQLPPGSYIVQAQYGYMPRLVAPEWVGFLKSGATTVVIL